MGAAHRGKPVIGIAGGIGAGKSTVAAELANLGCRVVDADAIGHELLGANDVRRELERRWGRRVFTPEGQVDREAVAEIVFAEPGELEALNRILHPRIRRRMEQQIDEALADPDAAGVVVDAAVLFEAGWDDLCTHRLFVAAPAPQRARRVAASRGWSRRTWQQREKRQISLDTKAARCDSTTDNSSSVSRLREQIRQLFHQWVHVAN
jgi:dephospho-CoA kinase